MRVAKYYLILIFIALLHQSSVAQNCSIKAPLFVCVDGFFSVEINASGGTPTQYKWDLGDGRSSIQAKTGLAYNKPGKYKLISEVTFLGGAKCYDTIIIEVFLPPTAQFVIDTLPNFCSNRKSICIKDISTTSPSGNPIVKRIFLWGDGTADNSTTPSTQNKICHGYIVAGEYLLAMEITDNKGCIAKKISNVKIADTLLPKLHVTTKTTGGINCKVISCFTNRTALPAATTKYIWVFGDGTIDSTTKNPCHEYKNNGSYSAMLVAVTKEGCRDTAFETVVISKPIINTNLVHKKSICLNETFTAVNNVANPNATYIWSAGLVSNNLIKIGEDNPLKYDFTTQGKYNLRLTIKVGQCEEVIDDTVDVMCPRANFKITNNAICVPGDTTYLCAEICRYKANNVVFIWDLKYGAQCTTDTKNGLNINKNCRYSLDENVKHVYNFGAPGQKFSVYKPELITKDTVTGCSDTRNAPVKLGVLDMSKITLTPDADEYCTKDKFKAQNDTRRRISYKLGGDSAVLDCKITLNLDSAEDPAAFEKYKLTDVFFEYETPDIDSGWKSAGLAYENGADSVFAGCNNTFLKLGTKCYDTAWINHVVNIMPAPKTQLITDTVFKYCAPHTLSVRLKDTIQKNIKSIHWIWGDGQADSLFFAKDDSILPAVKSHFYDKRGLFWPEIKITNIRGCEETQPLKLALGYRSNFVKDTLVCAGTNVTFYERLEYFDTSYKFWQNSNRSNSNKEQIWWDFDDGNGLVKKLQNQGGFFAKEGIYNIQRITQDSTGCSDTVTFTLKAIKPTAKFGQLRDTLYCNDNIVQFYDSSVGSTINPHKKVVSWSWDFGDYNGLKPQQHPLYIFKTFGDRTIKLTVENSIGCKDSTTSKVYFVGPQPFFEFASDSFGCAPFEVELKNNSLFSSAWIWNMGDSNNTIISTGLDTNITFTYNNVGTYYISLISGDSIYNPITKNKYYCTAEYPLPPIVKKVIVSPLYNTDFTHPDTVCIDKYFTMSNLSSPALRTFTWEYGDGARATASRATVRHKYRDTGLYTISLIADIVPPIRKSCVTNKKANIYVEDIKAGFDISTALMPKYTFNNTSSKSAVRYQWNFGDPNSGTLNTSTLKNPTHVFTALDTFKVCLVSFNGSGCSDTVCRTLIHNYRPYVFIPNVFTPNGKDTINARFDIDINIVRYYNLNIFNRWGQKVFEGFEDGYGNSDTLNWDGIHFKTGLPCPSGVYLVSFDYEVAGRSERVNYRGSLTLFRKD